MNPELDEQGRRGTWPFPLDSEMDRARKVAMMYRARLRALNPAACDEADATAASFGEDWMLTRPQIIEPDQELTTATAAELVNVHVDTIRKWACMRHPEHPDQPLLPRFGRRGKETTYLAERVLAAAVAMRRAQHARAKA